MPEPTIEQLCSHLSVNLYSLARRCRVDRQVVSIMHRACAFLYSRVKVYIYIRESKLVFIFEGQRLDPFSTPQLLFVTPTDGYNLAMHLQILITEIAYEDINHLIFSDFKANSKQCYRGGLQLLGICHFSY